MARFCDSISAPSVLIFDWHGTLVDTHDAMFSAMEDMLPQLEDLGLVKRLLPADKCRNTDASGPVRYTGVFGRGRPRSPGERGE